MFLSMSVGLFSLIFFSYIYKNNRALRAWTISQAFAALGTVFLVLRGIAPDVVSIVLGNTIIIGSFLFIYIGTLHFYQQPKRFVTGAVVALTIFGIFTYWFTFIDPNYTYRAYITSLYLFIGSVLTAASLIIFSRGINVSGLVLGYIFAIHSIVYLFRFYGLYNNEVDSLFNKSLLDQLLYSEATVIGVLVPIGYIMMVNERLIEDAKLQANSDPLTNLLNRRAFYSAAEPAYARCLREKDPISLLMVDIDKFKLVNDRYGHQVGDQVLVDLADCLRSQLRDADIIARFGGEEFVILMPATNENEAKPVADRLRETYKNLIASSNYPPPESTLSIGLVCSNAIAGGLEKIISEADKNLYQAKNSGRDQVISSTLI
jgi:diguanylate cyclase (GGDEF)-like protein